MYDHLGRAQELSLARLKRLARPANVMTANIRPLGHRIFAGVVASCASTALVTVAAAQPTGEAPPAGDAPLTVELSEAQLERMLERLAARESVSLLDLNSYVVVVGRAPKLSLFGSKSDLGLETATLGMPTHAEMMAIVMPSQVAQAGSADTLGIVTATAFGVLAPLAVKAVAGWLGGNDNDDDEPEAARFAGYTRTVQIGGDVEGASSVSFYRRGEQPVVLWMRVAESYTDGVQLEIDGHTLGVFEQSINDMSVPDELLGPDGDNGLHLLTVSPASDAVLGQPAQVDIVLVVYATDP